MEMGYEARPTLLYGDWFMENPLNAFWFLLAKRSDELMIGLRLGLLTLD